MRVIYYELTHEKALNYCLFCRCTERGRRHVHFNTLESFLRHFDRKRAINAAKRQKFLAHEGAR
jgi:hypothetical protein